MTLDLTRPHKRAEFTIKISANRQSTIHGGEEFFTMDSGGTAVGIFNFELEDENVGFKKLNLTGIKNILIGFDFTVVGSKVVFEPEILDAENGRVALVLPNQFEYSGLVLGYTYIIWEDGREQDGGTFQLTFTESWLDKELPEMEDFYVSRFEDLAEEIRRRVEEIKVEMDRDLKTVKQDLTTAQSDINKIQSQIDDNDIVRQDEFDSLAEDVNGIANIQYTVDKSRETINESREGKLVDRRLEGRTLVNLMSDNRDDFVNGALSNQITLDGATVTLNSTAINAPESSVAHDISVTYTNITRFEPGAEYTIMIDLDGFGPHAQLFFGHADRNLFTQPIVTSIANQLPNGRTVLTRTTHANLEGLRLPILVRRPVETPAFTASFTVTIIKGNWTGRELNHLPPLTLASVGEDVEEISVTTIGENLAHRTNGSISRGDMNQFRFSGLAPNTRYFIGFNIVSSTLTSSSSFGVILDESAIGPATLTGANGINGNLGLAHRYFTTPNVTGNLIVRIALHIDVTGGTATLENVRLIKAPVGSEVLPFSPYQSTTRSLFYQNEVGQWLPVPKLQGIMNGNELLIADEITETEYIQRVVEVNLTNRTSGGTNTSSVEGVTQKWANFSSQGVFSNGSALNVVCNKLATVSLGQRNRQPNWIHFNSGDTASIVFQVPESFGSNATEVFQFLANNGYKVYAPLAEPRRFPIRPWALPSYEPVTNLIVNSGAVSPRTSFMIATSLGQRLSVLTRRGVTLETELWRLTQESVSKAEVDALKPTTEPLPLANTPQIGASGQFADAAHVHQFPTATQVGAVPSSGGTLTGPLMTRQHSVTSHNGANGDAQIDIGVAGNFFTRFFARVTENRTHFGIFDVDRGNTWLRYRGDHLTGRVYFENVDVTMNKTLSVTGNITSPRFIGNADTATRLQTARNINGVPFDGTTNVSIDPPHNTIPAGTDLNTVIKNGFYQGQAAMINAPSGGLGIFNLIFLQRAATAGRQEYISAVGRRWTRNYTGGVFGAWEELPTQSGNTVFDMRVARANQLNTTRNITIGNTSKAFDGSTNLSYSLAEIGALPVNGNAVSATRLATPRLINGVAFDGSTNIDITAYTPAIRIYHWDNLEELMMKTPAFASVSIWSQTGALGSPTGTSYTHGVFYRYDNINGLIKIIDLTRHRDETPRFFYRRLAGGHWGRWTSNVEGRSYNALSAGVKSVEIPESLQEELREVKERLAKLETMMRQIREKSE